MGLLIDCSIDFVSSTQVTRSFFICERFPSVLVADLSFFPDVLISQVCFFASIKYVQKCQVHVAEA